MRPAVELAGEEAFHDFRAHPDTRTCSAVWRGGDDVRFTPPEGWRPLETLPIADASKCAPVRALILSYEDGDACADVVQYIGEDGAGPPPPDDVQRAICELFGMDAGPLPVVEEQCYYKELLPWHDWMEIPDYCGDEALALVERAETIRALGVVLASTALALVLVGAVLWWRRAARTRSLRRAGTNEP